jgi:hypothetical protein
MAGLLLYGYSFAVPTVLKGKMTKIIAAALSMLCVASAAQANTVYTWYGDNKVTPYGITLQMDLTDAAVATGSFKFDSASSDPTGLARFFYTYPGDAAAISWHEGQAPYYGNFRLDLAFASDGALSGEIFAQNFNNQISLEGTAGRFTITDAESDGTMEGAGCVHGTTCAGGTGVFTSYSYTVPEPGSLALIGLGVFGIGAIGRRKAKA